MSRSRLHVVVGHLQRLASAPAPETDGELLRRFAQRRDEAAFGELLRRHGPLVLGVCRRTLAHRQDAEDAFQATFLALVRQAGSISRGQAVAGWLYRVALRVAQKLRTDAVRRGYRELPEQEPSASESASPGMDAREVLDEELGRLPEKYRVPVVLCYLQGKTQAEAARELGWPVGTVSGRLAQARALLRGRLTRRGLTLPAALAVVVPAVLATATTRAAVASLLGEAGGEVSARVAALARGAGAAAGRVRAAAAVLALAVGLTAAGAGLLAHEAPAAKPPETNPPSPADRPRAEAPRAADRPTQFTQTGLVRNVVFPLGGRAVAFGGDRESVLRIHDLATGKELRRVTLKTNLTALALSPDGKTLAVGEGDGTLRLWEAETGKEVATLSRHTRDIFGLRFSPDGKVLASGSDDGQLCLWDVATGKLLHEPALHAGGLWAIAFAPDGKTLATGGRDPTLLVWDVATGKVVHQWVAPAPGTHTLLFAADGKTLISAITQDLHVRLWDVTAGKEVGQVGDGTEHVFALGLSPDGRLLATGSKEGAVRVWEVLTGREVGLLGRHDGEVFTAGFAPDGRTVGSGATDGTVRLWELADLWKGDLPRKAPDAAALERLWDDLGDRDAGRGWRAVWLLAAAPDQAVRFLQGQLKPPPAPDPKLLTEIARCIADLDSDDFEVRETATLRLLKLGRTAKAAARKALENPASVEARRRLERVLAPLDDAGPSGDALRALRSVAVLERIGSDDARRLLERLIREAPDDRLKAEAQASLRRLGR